jgi:hypothetical protein
MAYRRQAGAGGLMDGSRLASTANELLTREVTFKRSGAGQAIGGAGAGIGGILFLGMAALFLIGVIPAPLPMRILGGLMFGFFGLLMGAGAVASVQRGRDPRIAVVTPRGLWLSGMGELAWTAIAEVRLELVRGVGGYRNQQVMEYRRLGVVPQDASIRPRGAAALAERLTGFYFGLVRTMRPDVRLGNPDGAPFGVSQLELSAAEFDRFVDAVRAHHAVTDPS